jgi:hypothetical protein
MNIDIPGMMISYCFTGGEFSNDFWASNNTDTVWHVLLSDKLHYDVIIVH